jgi:hypothetical protein
VTVVIVRQTVADFDRWREVFRSRYGLRRRHGSTGYAIYRSLDDPNEVTVLLRFADESAARSCLSDPEVQVARAEGGVDVLAGPIFSEEIADVRVEWRAWDS